jgi:hypothetical protein
MALGAERAVFERPVEAGKHMHPLFIKGHIDGKPLGRMMVDSGLGVNIMPMHMFERLGHDDGELKKTNLSLSGFAGEPGEAQVALTSLCETRLTDTAAMPIVLFPVRNQEDPVWKQCLEAMSNPEGPHFHAGVAALAGYAQHMFNLQASTGRTVMRQHLHSSSLEQHVEELRRASAILRSGMPPPSD